MVTPGFFETLQIPRVRGRTFDERDQRSSAPVMMINQEFARKFFPDEDPKLIGYLAKNQSKDLMAMNSLSLISKMV